MKRTAFCIHAFIGRDMRFRSPTFGEPAAIYEVYRGHKPPGILRVIFFPLTARRVTACYSREEAQAWIDRYNACEAAIEGEDRILVDREGVAYPTQRPVVLRASKGNR